ncbi:MAG: cell division protein ZapA [Pseudoxanthomonas sp.]
MSGEVVNVHILDREYAIGVEPSERSSLTAAARMLDTRMREVRGAHRMASVDRIAVLAALNLAHELQQLRDERSATDAEFTRTLADLNRRLEHWLEPR